MAENQPMVCRWSVLVPIVLLTLSACSGTAHGPSGQHRTTESTATPTMTTGATPAGNLKILTCKDSAGGGEGSRTVNGVSSGGFSGTHAEPKDVFSLIGSDGHKYLLWKTFLNVAPSAAPYRTISVTRPSTARLYYADPGIWGTASEAERVTDATRRVRLPTCGSRFSGFTGGIVVSEPTCVTLKIASPSGANPKEITIPVATKHC